MSASPVAAVQGLLVDLDGTLADTLPALKRVYREFLVAHGIESQGPPFDRMNGLELRAIIETLQREAGLPGDPHELARHYREHIARAYADAEPNHGALDLLKRAREAGVRTAVVTSGNREEARDWLRHTALAPYVCEIVGAGEASRGKPFPEPYRLALDKLGADASRSLAIEDSVPGAQSALGAGLSTFVLVHRDEPTMDWPSGVRFIDSLSEVTASL